MVDYNFIKGSMVTLLISLKALPYIFPKYSASNFCISLGAVP